MPFVKHKGKLRFANVFQNISEIRFWDADLNVWLVEFSHYLFLIGSQYSNAEIKYPY